MLFGRSKAAELAPNGIQKVVLVPGPDAVRAMDDAVAELQGQAAVIGVHEAWF